MLYRIFKKLLQELSKLGCYKTSDKKYWKGLKGMYKGQRGFVICNGPSLSASDLEKMRGEITIASNKIYLIFNQTKWRPTLYTVADVLVWEKIKDGIHKHFSIVHLPNYLDRGKDYSHIKLWKSPLSLGKRKFSDDLSVGAYGGHTVTYENIQIAVHLGLNPIYLVGCDHNYPGEKDVKIGVPILQGSKQTHFVKEYRSEGEKVLPAPIAAMNYSYAEAKTRCDERGVSLVNITRGGELNIFPRENIDDIFS